MLSTLQRDLQQWGPERLAGTVPTLAAARAYTRQVALGHYENFPVVTWFLPRELRQPFYDVYAFCRWADDLGDELGSPSESLRMLAWWREELVQCLQGSPRHPVYVALAETIKQYELAGEAFHDLITAFEQDQTHPRYESYAGLLDYCRYSANPVGRILLQLTRSSNPQTVALSDSVCTGLQLINFWQDVARDWDIGRVYLPQADLRQFAVSEETIARREITPQFRELLRMEVDRAETLLQAGLVLGDLVHQSVRFDIRLFALGGLCLCKKIRRLKYDVLTSRPKLNKSDLPLLFWQAWKQS